MYYTIFTLQLTALKPRCYHQSMKFNDSQAIAIHHGSGPMLVLAGPGSGKTAVIIQRIHNLITTFGISPDKILAVTFSRAAAGEMSERFRNLMPDMAADAGPAFATFHSIFLSILKSSSSEPVTLISQTQKYAFIRSKIERYNLPCESINSLAKEIFLAISKNKCGLSDANSTTLSDDAFRRISFEYSAYMKLERLIDFDDIIINCLQLLEENPDILKSWQKKFQYILVDEFQDISPMQYKTISLLAGENANIFVVGDDDQSIYGFRGASPDSLRQFLDDFPAARQVLLNINYRCDPLILDNALKVIGRNSDRFEKEISAAKGNENANPVTLDPFPSRRDEYEHIIKTICGYQDAGINDIAILFRNNADYLLLARMLEDQCISYISADKPTNFLASFAISDILAYMELAANLRNGSSAPCLDIILKIINRPLRYITRDSLKGGEGGSAGQCFASMKRAYKDNRRMLTQIQIFEQDLRLIATLRPAAAIRYIRDVIGYDKWLKTYTQDKHTDFEEFESCLDMLEDYAENAGSYKELKEMISKSLEKADDSKKAFTSSGKASIPPVMLLTMHASKGKEFDVVFLPDVNDSIIPNKMMVSENNENEECRLLYVAMTRAKNHLHISWSERLHNKAATLSRFIENLTNSKFS